MTLPTNGNFLQEELETNDLETWEAPLELRNNYRYYQAGFDKQKRPVWIIELGKWNMRKIVQGGPEMKATFDKYVLQAVYRTKKSIADRNAHYPQDPIDSVVAIADFTDINYLDVLHFPTSSFMVSLARKYSKISDFIHVLFMLNMTSIAHLALRIIKPVMGSLYDKLKIYGTKKEKWLPDLLDSVDPDQIPEIYGGSPNFEPFQIFYI